MKTKNISLTQDELRLLNQALRTRMIHEHDDNKYIEFMRLKDTISNLLFNSEAK